MSNFDLRVRNKIVSMQDKLLLVEGGQVFVDIKDK